MVKGRPPSTRTIRSRAGDIQALRSFHYRDFRLLWVGTMLSSVGMWLQMVSVSWLVLRLTDSPVFVALAFGMYFLPGFFLGPFSGTLADRVNRKRLLVSVYGLNFLASFLLAVLVITDTVEVWSVLTTVLFVGIGLSFMMPVVQTLIYDIVEPQDAQNGIAILPAAFKLVGIVGAVAGGIMVETVGMGVAFSVAASSFALSVVIVSFMRYEAATQPAAMESVVANIVEGFRLFANTPALTWIVGTTMVVEGFGYGSMGMLPIFADRGVLDVGASGLGLMNGAIGFGGVLGALALASRGELRSKGRLYLALFLIYGIFIGGFSQSNDFALSLVLLTCWGVVQGVYRHNGHTAIAAARAERNAGTGHGRIHGVHRDGPLRGFVPGVPRPANRRSKRSGSRWRGSSGGGYRCRRHSAPGPHPQLNPRSSSPRAPSAIPPPEAH